MARSVALAAIACIAAFPIAAGQVGQTNASMSLSLDFGDTPTRPEVWREGHAELRLECDAYVGPEPEWDVQLAFTADRPGVSINATDAIRTDAVLCPGATQTWMIPFMYRVNGTADATITALATFHSAEWPRERGSVEGYGTIRVAAGPDGESPPRPTGADTPSIGAALVLVAALVSTLLLQRRL